MQLNKTIESLNNALLERTHEINALQKSLQETEYRYTLQEAALRQEHEKILMKLRREYDEKLRALEIKVQKMESTMNEFKLENARLIDEVEYWKRRYADLEKMKQKEIVIEKPIYVKEEKIKTVVDEEEVRRLKDCIREIEFKWKQAEDLLFIKDQELQRTYISIEELQVNLRELDIEIQRVKEENTIIIRDREKM